MWYCIQCSQYNVYTVGSVRDLVRVIDQLYITLCIIQTRYGFRILYSMWTAVCKTRPRLTPVETFT